MADFSPNVLKILHEESDKNGPKKVCLSTLEVLKKLIQTASEGKIPLV